MRFSTVGGVIPKPEEFVQLVGGDLRFVAFKMPVVVARAYRLEGDARHESTRRELRPLGIGDTGADVLNVNHLGFPDELFDLLGPPDPSPGTLRDGLLRDRGYDGGDEHAHRDEEDRRAS